MKPLFFVRKTIHRQLLEEELKKLSDQLTGKILDIGSKDARYANWFTGEMVSVDITPNPEKGVLTGNIYNLNFTPNSFDGVLSTEVFQYLTDPKKALDEIYKILKPGGILLLSAPLVYRVHEDLVRYTETAWRKLLGHFSKIEFFYIGNFYTIILDIARDKLTKLPNRFFRYLAYIPFFIFTLFIPLSFKFPKDRSFVSGYLITARK